ncbi:hypothetical protein B0H14DRAFT_2803041 [Mycena olivaceomarginata]|nr:hypothetical protein B0H14DRAFT_2803041 [Mycena olivaceomarginata]
MRPERDDWRHGTTSIWPVVRANVPWPVTLANVASLARKAAQKKRRRNRRGATAMSTHGTPRERDDSRHGTTSVWPVVRPNVSWPATLAKVASLMPHRRRQKTKEKANGRGASTRSALRTRRLAPRYHLYMACGETQCIVARDASKCRVSHAPSARMRRHHATCPKRRYLPHRNKTQDFSHVPSAQSAPSTPSMCLSW